MTNAIKWNFSRRSTNECPIGHAVRNRAYPGRPSQSGRKLAEAGGATLCHRPQLRCYTGRRPSSLLGGGAPYPRRRGRLERPVAKAGGDVHGPCHLSSVPPPAIDRDNCSNSDTYKRPSTDFARLSPQRSLVHPLRSWPQRAACYPTPCRRSTWSSTRRGDGREGVVRSPRDRGLLLTRTPTPTPTPTIWAWLAGCSLTTPIKQDVAARRREE